MPESPNNRNPLFIVAITLFLLLTGASARQLVTTVKTISFGESCLSSCYYDSDCSGFTCTICVGSDPSINKRGTCQNIQ